MQPEFVEKKNRKKLWRWSKVIVFTYCAIGIALYYLQEKLLFHPEPLPADFKYQFNIPFEEIFIPFNQNDSTNVVKFLTKKVRRGIVLYFHGNKGNIARYARYAKNFTSEAFEVWMIDYPGYGKSTGKISEKYMYRQAEELFKLAANQVSKDSIIVYGKSLGSGPAAYIAYMKECHQLVLETPYYSMADLVFHYAPVFPVRKMSHYEFPVYKYISELKASVTVFHGTDDHVIPYSEASKLKAIMKPGDQFITIVGGSHNDLNDNPLFQEKLHSLLNQ